MPIRPSDVLLDGRVAVVTGGGSGIGRGIAAGFAAFGASVAIRDQNPESCADAAAEIGAPGITTDVRDSAAVDAGQTIHVDGGTHAAGGWYHHPETGDHSLGPTS